MERTEFKETRAKDREKLFKKIVETFTALHPYALHQFGSGTHGYRDEFSDIDIWVTFPDDQIERVLKKLNQIFKDIAPVLIRHHSKSWSPVGGSANSVIHDCERGPLIVDYYISKLSETVLKTDAAVLFGSDTLPRGEWRLNKEVNPAIHDSHTLRNDTTLLINLIFGSIKVMVRDPHNKTFIETVKVVHRKFRQRYNYPIKRRQIGLTFQSDYRLLSDLYKVSTKRQRSAINKIRRYAKVVEDLYSFSRQ